MALKTALLGDVPMLVMTGPLDLHTSSSLEAALDKLVQARFSVIFLDLSEVDHVDRAGLAALHAGARSLGQRGWIGLIGPSADVRRLLEADGVLAEPRIRVFADRQAALVATGERAST